MNKAVTKCLLLLGICVLSLGLCGCTQTKEQTQKKTSVAASGTAAAKKAYDEHITGVIKRIDEETETLVLLETLTAAETVLHYTDSTEVYNKYGNIKTMAQFSLGDIVEAYFLSEDNEIVKIENSASAWTYENVKKFSIRREKEMLRISDRKYQYDLSSLVVAQDGQTIDLLAINEQDTLAIQGIGSRVYSITVTQGHGYVRFRNYDQFVGGMVEIGYGIIRNVTEDMLLVVPEGSYQMVMERGTLRAQKQIAVTRGKELIVDLSEYQIKEEKKGRVYFQIQPEGAQLNINGVPVVYTEAVELNYGKNVIQVVQEGYTSYTGKLNVKKEYQVVKISLAKESAQAEVLPDETLDEEEQTENDPLEEEEVSEEEILEEETEDTDSEEKTENMEDAEKEEASEDSEEVSDEETDTSIEDVEMKETEVDTENTITVNAPSGAKVYVNGDYVGKSPVSFEKIIGTFTVALSKNGYDTASYTLTIEDDGESTFLSFPDLAASEEA